MERAIEAVPAWEDGAASRLSRAGLGALESVIRGAGGRESAVDLLAADALLTRACQSAAREGEEPLRALLRQLDPSVFEALLEREAGS